jgi:uncharacterized protein YkwD
MRYLIVLLYALCLVTTPARAEGPVQQFLDKVNELRQQHHLRPLQLDARLTRFSLSYSKTMARDRSFDIDHLDGRDFEKRILETGYSFQRVALQVAAGYPTPAHLMTHWETDPQNNQHILSPDLREIGIGYTALANDPRGHTHYWAITFATPTQRVTGNWRSEVLTRVNAFRARYKLGPLRIDDDLNEAAQAHSNDMAEHDYFSHIAPDGSSAAERAERAGYHWQSILENIAAGQASPDEVVSGWIHSDSHRAAMLERDINEAGIGYRFLPGDTGRARHVHYWVLVMGRR